MHQHTLIANLMQMFVSPNKIQKNVYSGAPLGSAAGPTLQDETKHTRAARDKAPEGAAERQPAFETGVPPTPGEE